MSAKRILGHRITGQRGAKLIKYVLLRMGFLCYLTGGVQASMDAMIASTKNRTSVSGEVTDSVVQVTYKAAAKRNAGNTAGRSGADEYWAARG